MINFYKLALRCVRPSNSATRKIFVASLLFAVAGSQWMLSAAGAATITVKSGDSLTLIAKQHGIPLQTLVAANHLVDPNHIEIGTILQIPAPVIPGTSSVVVHSGNTLLQIAVQFHTSVESLVAENHLVDPNQLTIGMTLQVPATHPLPALLVAHSDRLALEPLLKRWATTFSVSPDLLEALCWWESGWQNTVVSSTGAVGIGQLEPDTVALMRLRLNNAALNPTSTSDNIEMSAGYLSYLLSSTHDDVRMALAAYYQGLESVSVAGVLPSTTHYVDGIVAYIPYF